MAKRKETKVTQMYIKLFPSTACSYDPLRLFLASVCEARLKESTSEVAACIGQDFVYSQC